MVGETVVGDTMVVDTSWAPQPLKRAANKRRLMSLCMSFVLGVGCWVRERASVEPL